MKQRTACTTLCRLPYDHCFL